MGKRRKWIITTDSVRPISEIASDLAVCGFTVDTVLGEIGSITGFTEAGSVRALKEVDGVVDVSADTDVDIGPPGSDTTW